MLPTHHAPHSQRQGDSKTSQRHSPERAATQARNALTTIAKYSGGQAYFPRFEQDIPDIYRQIAGQLRTQYSLGFVPTDPAKDGKYHKLDVQLVDTQENPLVITDKKGKKVKYRVSSREGYYSPKT